MNNLKKLKGKLNGELCFSQQSISVEKRIIPITEIKKIEIRAADWIGRNAFNASEWDFENGLSRGVYNFLIITYEKGRTDKIQFQMNHKCEFKDLNNIIEHYYSLNKIEYLNCVDLLCLSNKDEWRNLKNKTTANTA